MKPDLTQVYWMGEGPIADFPRERLLEIIAHLIDRHQQAEKSFDKVFDLIEAMKARRVA